MEGYNVKQIICNTSRTSVVYCPLPPTLPLTVMVLPVQQFVWLLVPINFTLHWSHNIIQPRTLVDQC